MLWHTLIGVTEVFSKKKKKKVFVDWVLDRVHNLELEIKSNWTFSVSKIRNQQEISPV